MHSLLAMAILFVAAGAAQASPPVIPDVQHTPVQPTSADNIFVSCTVVDDGGIWANIGYLVNGVMQFFDAMNAQGGESYSYSLGSWSDGDCIRYYVTVLDGEINEVSSDYVEFCIHDGTVESNPVPTDLVVSRYLCKSGIELGR